MIRHFSALAVASLFATPVTPQVAPPPCPTPISFHELSHLDQVDQVAKALDPLLDEIADVEGGAQVLNAVNRGYAGDTPGGSQSVLGRNLTDMTVAEVMQAQRWQVFAVGGYQFIPGTLRELVKRSNFDASLKFDADTQQQLAVLLIKYHRPTVWNYITSSHGSQYGAALEMAKEWASLGHPANDRSYYAGWAGNSAKVRSGFVIKVLNEARGTLAQPLEL